MILEPRFLLEACSAQPTAVARCMFIPLRRSALCSKPPPSSATFILCVSGPFALCWDCWTAPVYASAKPWSLPPGYRLVGGCVDYAHAKYGHTRLIPVQSSTLEALQRYRTLRDQAVAPPLTRLSLSPSGQASGLYRRQRCLSQTVPTAGWTQPPVPRLHDLRHTFAVRTLLVGIAVANPSNPNSGLSPLIWATGIWPTLLGIWRPCPS